MGDYLGYLNGVRINDNIVEPYDEAVNMDWLPIKIFHLRHWPGPEQVPSGALLNALRWTVVPIPMRLVLRARAMHHGKTSKDADAYLIPPNDDVAITTEESTEELPDNERSRKS